MTRTLALLEKLAAAQPSGSPEVAMIASAAKALILVHDAEVAEKYAQFLRDFHRDLTPDELAEVQRRLAP
ncbi:MAG: hypothetical protein H0X38_09895 [Planctomycetes bacterium]|nr:hypothetical protein [Planctomycetota bacterium]